MRWILTAPLLLVLLLSTACFGGGGDKQPDDTPTPEPTATPDGSLPEVSLGLYVQSNMSKEYAGECAQANAQTDAGKICSTFQGEREGLRAYKLGETFTEASEWAIMGQQGGLWVVVHTQKITADNAGVPGIPWPLKVGAEVMVTGTGRCLNVREGPGLDQAAVDCIDDGAVISLAAGPTLTEEYEWWQVSGRTGWVVSDYLRYPDAAQDAPPPPPTQAPAAEVPTETPVP